MQKQVITICLIIALLEGFSGLGIEIYAIRISATYIGSSISITGVILAMVLIAIAVGYWYGGRLSQSIRTPREALLKAGFVLSLSAVSHAIACIIQLPLLAAMTSSTDNPIVAAIGVGLLYGVGLAFGSTCIPLITQFLTLQYESQNHIDAGKNAGMMVAVTTIGSVLGSTVTPILLLPYIGLMSSLALFIVALALSAGLCTWLATYIGDRHSHNKSAKQDKPYHNYVLSVLAVITTIIFISINKIDTGYQTATGAWFIKNIEFEGKQAVIITDKPGQSTSSCWVYETKKNCHWYGEVTIEAIERIVPSSLVFLGGAGMAIPSEVAYHNLNNSSITVVDIDTGLPAIIEAHFLKESIASNIEFVGDDARGYLNRNHTNHYDFMFIDAFQGRFVASNLYTLEALTKFKVTSKFIMANIIGRPVTEHGYTQTLFKNWYEVFGESAYVITRNNSADLQNIMLCNFACTDGKKLSEVSFFHNDQKTHTDDLPRLDKYYYRSIEQI
ncbi:fused MFS/spermidine synthase [Psychrobacter immobilis]|uniref:fused MFS/spermidine synthase n=1 Tax=Psychrobacter immobilis TaxID=498 RepID=UPI0019189019|nr:fused MFS/spermidine synthase [Psychrobacter immobilis]